MTNDAAGSEGATKRLAVIGDIQGNGVALAAVLAAIGDAGVDRIMCLGDLVSGPAPLAVLAMLRDARIVCVRGNMDALIADPVAYTGDDADERKYADMDAWCHAQLSEIDRAYLRSLPLTHAFSIGGKQGLAFHGAPGDTEGVIDAGVADEQLRVLLAGVAADVLLTGHMHRPMLRRLGEQLIINPGSVGLPFGGKQPMPTRAEYALLDGSDGDLAVTFAQVNYNGATFRQEVLASGMPHVAWWLAHWKV